MLFLFFLGLLFVLPLFLKVIQIRFLRLSSGPRVKSVNDVHLFNLMSVALMDLVFEVGASVLCGNPVLMTDEVLHPDVPDVCEGDINFQPATTF